MLVQNFMRFRRKRLEEQTHIDNFSLKKNPKRIYLFSLYPLMSIKEVSKNKKKKIPPFSSFLLGNVIFTYSMDFI